jgi:hypothetical protein
MTAPPAEPTGSPEPATVIVIDLRAAASGPDAAEAGSIDGQTLEERQRRADDGSAGSPGWRIVNLERLLVVDDAAAFAQHEDGYRHLIEAPTFGRMLCLVIGPPPDPPYLDVPGAADAARVPVLWIGDPRGVGWQIGRANTTRLAFSNADPDGSVTVASIIESLHCPVVFDEMAIALSGLLGRTGVPALLPQARWPLRDRDAAGHDHQSQDDKPEDDEPAGQEPDIAATSAAAEPGDRAPTWWRSRRAAISLLLALGCGTVAVATLLAIRFSRLNIGYAVADAVLAAVLLLAIAHRVRIVSATPVSVPAPVPAPVPIPVPRPVPSPRAPEAELSLTAAPVPEEVLARAVWMMNASVADEAFRQLSAPEQLVMLDADPGLARLLRFAPGSAQPLIESAADGSSISWTPTGDQLEVIRLVPMKAGLVRRRGA